MNVGVIGGTGLSNLDGGWQPVADSDATPYGPASAIPRRYDALPNAVFLNRHADDHALPPHQINYRANLWLLNRLGVDAVLAVFAVGGISRPLANGHLVLPGQLIDYTWGRAHTYATADSVVHADFTDPFDTGLRKGLVEAGTRSGVELLDGGVYGCTQGPRLETAAEVDRLERDGCTVVGMTAMPEAALARELGLPYAGICMIVNPAAGRGSGIIEVADMHAAVEEARPRLLGLLVAFLKIVCEGL